MNESILDKVISSQQASLISELNPKTIVDFLLQFLNEREREILILRHGLDQKGKKTLENIGNKFNITRERVRQIENSAIKKIKNLPEANQAIEPVEITINQILEQAGSLMAEELLAEELLAKIAADSDYKVFITFIISQLLKDRLHYLSETDNYHSGWMLPSFSLEIFEEVLKLILNLIESIKEPVKIENLVNQLQEEHKNHPHKHLFEESAVRSYLDLSKKIKANPFNEWGLDNWELVNLKRISDKVYLVLKKENAPLHFTQIAKKINDWGIDQKIANPATIHNELILDDKYVLVGRGIYALKEWGYQPGIVSEVIADILKTAQKPMSREEIINEVLKRRFVKRSTIILALMDKSKFSKNANSEYVLKTV